MTLYELSIIGFDGDITTVNDALANAGISVNAEEAQSMNKESSVFVDPGQLGQAIQVLNSLGYATDEDDE